MKRLEAELAEQLRRRVQARRARSPEAKELKSQELCALRVTGKDGGTFIIDRSGPEPTVRRGNDDAHCIITLSASDLRGVLGGELDPRQLFLSGRLKISGYLHVALQVARALSDVLDAGRAEAAPTPAPAA